MFISNLSAELATLSTNMFLSIFSGFTWATKRGPTTSYTIKEHYRAGLIQRLDILHQSDYEKYLYNSVKVFMIGAFFTYLF